MFLFEHRRRGQNFIGLSVLLLVKLYSFLRHSEVFSLSGDLLCTIISHIFTL